MNSRGHGIPAPAPSASNSLNADKANEASNHRITLDSFSLFRSYRRSRSYLILQEPTYLYIVLRGSLVESLTLRTLSMIKPIHS